MIYEALIIPVMVAALGVLFVVIAIRHESEIDRRQAANLYLAGLARNDSVTANVAQTMSAQAECSECQVALVGGRCPRCGYVRSDKAGESGGSNPPPETNITKGRKEG